jgi:hypothetical protein
MSPHNHAAPERYFIAYGGRLTETTRAHPDGTPRHIRLSTPRYEGARRFLPRSAGAFTTTNRHAECSSTA